MTIELCLSIIGAVTGIVGAVTGIVGAVTGIVGAAIGIHGILHNRFLAIRQYMEGLEAPDFIRAKTYISNIDINLSPIPLNSEEAAQIVGFFHHWGLLARKHYLPLWVFDSGSGAAVIRYYELTKEYIEEKRKLHGDDTYANNFEWLYHELKDRRTQ